ncbi:MAG: metal-dependent transcriptional regulator [bacterium JZ-2024 1]
MTKKYRSVIEQMRRKGLTSAMEDYVKAIYLLEQKGNKVTTTELAGMLKVRPPSVTGMMKKLASWKLLQHTPYRGVRLTPIGKRVALEIVRHHRLLELYLTSSMGYSWDMVHQEAEHLEHFISEDFEEKMNELLNNPEKDPHGSPIPRKDGKCCKTPSFLLSSASPHDRLVVQEVEDEDPEFLRYLDRLHLRPGSEIEVLEKHPFQGPLRIKIGNTQVWLDWEAARRISAVYQRKPSRRPLKRRES